MSRIWDVDGIEWEDLPTVSDLLCAADTKILAREVALRYGGRADVIFAEALPNDDMGLAYMNRLLRSAGFNII